MEKDITLMAHYHHQVDTHAPKKRKLELNNFQVLAGHPSFSMNNSPSRIFWHSFKETTGSAKAAYEILDGTNSSARVLLEVTLAAGESTRDFFGERGLKAFEGLYFNLVSGSVKGMVAGCLELDYQDDLEQVEVMNFPGEIVRVEEVAHEL